MAIKGSITLALFFLIALFVVGVPYWQIPYMRVSLPNAVWGWPLLVVSVLAAASRIVWRTRLWPTTLVLGAAVPGAVFARVIVDGVADPASHNLWPFELVLSAGPGFLAALVGALLGGLWVVQWRRT